MKRTESYQAKQYLDQVIGEKIDELKRSGPDGSTASAMVYAEDEEDPSLRLSRQQIIDNIYVLLVAGSETSSNTLTNAMLLLGLNPSVWNRLVAEQEELVAKHGDQITSAIIKESEAPYLDGVIRETMRLFPISFGGARNVDETIVLDGYQIPKNWLAVYNVALTHYHDPTTWQDDGSHMDFQTGFAPERWLDKDTRPTSEFIPFGAGHRFCLGHILAMSGALCTS